MYRAQNGTWHQAQPEKERSSAGQVKCLAAVFRESTAKGGLTGEAADPLAAVQGSVPQLAG